MANAMGIEPIMTTAAEATISGSRDATQAINGRQNDTSADAVLCCSPEDMGDLVEYCWGNGSTHWGGIRAADGHPEPYRVRYYELGKMAMQLSRFAWCPSR